SQEETSNPPTKMGSFAVGDPDVLHLGGMFEKPAAFRLFGFEPVNRAAFVGKNLLEISHGIEFSVRCCCFVAEAPDCVKVIVFGQDLQQLRNGSCNDVDCTSRQITSIKKLVKISGNQRIGF